ncbi:MarR family winged helix-turn-helix transcriptional regulator [Microlunatus parietis]|uniref:DNA-binding MarR family transcriptional regulator n=1 Tax=Microlunatus parietis TaxID=682979 RepID=A0A7Y9LA02_9ACTN|nr:MarR family transcriptional regulator [Microlunatus parietis]NYE69135.1 DNA-binding MarR family transcriptional regulator [Microlunatus parietis]
MSPAEKPAFAQLAEMPGWLVGQASLFSHRLLIDRLAEEGARPYHYRLLAALDEAGPLSQADLGRRTGIDRSDVVAALDELVAAGFMERAPDEADRRRNVVTVTGAGKRRLRKLHRLVNEVQDEFVAPLTAAERKTLVRLLGRILDHHREA